MRFFSVVLLFIAVCFLGGCIEANDNLSILKDGSCVDSRVLKIKTGLMSKIDSEELVEKFENDTHTLIDPVKQMKKEEREKEFSYDR